MIEDVAGGIFRVVGRFIGRILVETVFELFLKGPGYFSGKLFSKGNPDPDGFIVLITGIIFWVAVGFGAYSIYSNLGIGNNA